MRALIAVAVASLILAGCMASTDYWVMDGVRGEERTRLVTIHDGYCTMVANNAVRGRSMPYVPPPAGGTSYVHGTIDGRPYSGAVTTVPNSGQSFASGVSTGMAIGEAIREGEERRKIHKACMMANGWREKTDKDM